jgi:hypothetical protein
MPLSANAPFLLRAENDVIIVGPYSTEDTNIALIITILLLQGPFLNIEDLMPLRFRSSRVIIQPVFQLVVL